MTAHWISIFREITDEAKAAAYAELAGPALIEFVRDLRIVPGVS